MTLIPELLTGPGPAPLADRLRRIRHVALDMDGTIYRGGTLFPFTTGFLERMCDLGIGYTFLTNNPSKGVADYLAHLREMGIAATPEQLFTSAQATIGYLRRHHPEYRRVFVLGTASMLMEFESRGFVLTRDDPDDVPDAVIVGFDLTLSYSRVCRATWWISKGLPFVATNPDRVCPTDQPTVLVDCGSICAMLEVATGRKPDLVFGKPDPAMLDGILAAHGLQAGEVAMVGDRLSTDILMACRVGALAVLVLSGEATRADAAAYSPAPDLVLPDLAALGDLLDPRTVNLSSPSS